MKIKHERELYSSQMKVLDSLVPAMVSWAKERGDFLATLQTISAMAFDMGAPRFDPEWYAGSRVEYVVSNIITNAGLLAEFKNDVGPQLQPQQQALLKTLRNNPAYWAFYEVSNTSQSQFITCEVTLDSSETILVRHLRQNMDAIDLFSYRLVLVFDNGSFTQTTNFQHSYASVDNESMLFYLTGLQNGAPLVLNSTSMTRCINKYYSEVVLLDSVAFEENTILGQDVIEVLWGNYLLPPNFIPRHILGRWRYSRRGSFLCMVYDKPDKQLLQQKVPPHLRPAGGRNRNDWKFPEYFVLSLFIDLEARQLAAYANTKTAWQLLCFLLAPEIAVLGGEGKQADFRASFPVLSVTAQLEDFTFPWSTWEPLLTPLAREILDEPLEISKSRAVLHEYLDNEDHRFNLEARCLRMDVNPLLIIELAHAIEVIEAMDDSERGVFTLTSIPGDFELDDFAPPLEEELSDLMIPLEESVLFYLDVRNAYPLFVTYTHGTFVDAIEASNLIESIDDFFYEFYISDDFPYPAVMNYLFLLFLHTGKQWIPVRTYVIELLKFLFAFVESEDEEDEEDEADILVAQLSQFFYDQLCHFALVEVREEPSAEQLIWGTYVVRPTDFFFALIHNRV